MSDFLDFLRRKTKCFILDNHNRTIICKKISINKQKFNFKDTCYLIPDLKENIGTKRFNVPQLFYRFNNPIRLTISEQKWVDKEGRNIDGKFIQNEMEAKLFHGMLRNSLDKFLIILMFGLVIGICLISGYAMYLLQNPTIVTVPVGV